VNGNHRLNEATCKRASQDWQSHIPGRAVRSIASRIFLMPDQDPWGLRIEIAR